MAGHRTSGAGALLLVGASLVACGGSDPPPPGPRPDTIAQRVALPADAGAVAVGGGSVWVGLPGAVAQIGQATHRITRTVDVGLIGLDVAFGHGSLWAVGTAEGRRRRTAAGSYPVIEVVRVDPAGGTVTARIAVPARSNGNRVLATPTGVWVSDPAEGSRSRIWRIDPRTDRLDRRPLGRVSEPLALSLLGASVWVANHDDRTLRRLEEATGRLRDVVRLPASPHGMAVTGGAVWIADAHHGAVLRVEPARGRVGRAIPVGFETGALAPAAGGGVWVAGVGYGDGPSRTLVRLAASGRVAARTDLGAAVVDVEAQGRVAWVTTTAPDQLLAVTPG
jgi:DNA-binding beta-propeller fold protein YncE